MTNKIEISDALYAAVTRANELIAQDSITERDRESLTAHLDYIKLNSEKIQAAAALIDFDIESVVIAE